MKVDRSGLPGAARRGMTRRQWLRVGCAGGAWVAWAAAGQPPPAVARLRRVGVLEVTPESARVRATVVRAMNELGWAEGRNVEYLWASADGDETRLDALARELVAGGAEVLATSAAVATRALQRATPTVPIVMVNVVDPVGNGFAASLVRPGGNITGLTNQQQDLLAKQAELLRQLLPTARRVAFVFNEKNPAFAAYRGAMAQAAAANRFEPVLVTVRSRDQIAAALQHLRGSGVQGAVMAADPLFTTTADTWNEQFAALKLPVIFGQRLHVERGGLLSYGTNFTDNWRHAARYVDRLLKGARAAELPIEQPTRFDLVLNLRTARRLGLTVPQALLVRADEVIE